jgi:hypothetical protein
MLLTTSNSGRLTHAGLRALPQKIARRTAVVLLHDVNPDVDRVSEKQAADHPLRAAHGIFTRFG